MTVPGSPEGVYRRVQQDGAAVRVGSSLRRRLLRQFLLVTLVAVAALTLSAVALLVPALVAHGEARNRELASAVRDQVQLQLLMRQRAAEQLASELSRGAIERREVTATLQSLVTADRFLLAAYLVDLRGIVTHVALQASAGQNVADLIGIDQSAKPHFMAAMRSRQPTWSETFLSTMSGQVTAVLVVPAGSTHVMLEFSLAGLSQSLASLGRSGETRTVVLDRAGRIIAHPDAGQALRQENLGGSALVARAADGRAESGRLVLEGEEHLAFALPVPSIGWTILVAQPTRWVLGPLLRLGWVLLAIVGLTLAAAAAASWWLSQRAGREVERLADAAQYAATGGSAPPPMSFDTAEFGAVWRRLQALFDELHEREGQTRAAQGDLQAVLDAATEVAIVATDTEGVVTVFSAGARKILQRLPDDVIGRVTPALWHDADEVAARGAELTRQLGQPISGFEVFAAQARHGGYEVRDWTFIRADGQRLLVSLAVTAVRQPDGTLKGFLGVGIDITHRRRAESLELAQRSAEAASLAKSEFLSRMSHELRSPLNAMLGYAQLLEMDIEEPPAPGQRARAQQIQRAGWHLVQLIDDVLDLSRIEAGQMRMSLEAVNALQVADRAAEMTASLMTRFGVSFTQRRVGADQSTPLPPVLADVTRLTQVLVNLLGNAAKYNRPAGTVVLECEILDSRHLAYRVIDSGRGMSPQQLAQLFQPFNRLGQETGTIEGTGIGLVITQRLVALMNGTLTVSSSPGIGSTFTVTLPLGEQASLAPVAAPASGGDARSLRGTVLYIEDNEVNAMLMREILRQRPHVKLLQAATVASGLALMRQHRPGLLLLDMHLPDAHGSVAIDAMQVDPALRDTPIIVVSADATRQQIGAMRARGVRGYLTKPLNVPEALAAIDAALSGASADASS